MLPTSTLSDQTHYLSVSIASGYQAVERAIAKYRQRSYGIVQRAESVLGLREQFGQFQDEASNGMSVPSQTRRIVRDSVERLRAYQPAEAPEQLARRLGMPLEQILKLDSNENPYGCSLRVQEALAAFDRYHFYPDANATAARERIAGYAGTPVERLILGNGADELIDLLLLTVIDPGDEVILPTPTFGVYRARAELFGGTAVEVPRDASSTSTSTPCWRLSPHAPSSSSSRHQTTRPAIWPRRSRS